MKSWNWLTVGIGALIISGCATARVVTKYPNKGGVIAIPSEGDSKSRGKAEEIMRANCGSAGFEVLEEGEAVVGSKATTESKMTSELVSTKKSKILGVTFTHSTGGDNTSSTTTTQQETEWRLTYSCRT